MSHNRIGVNNPILTSKRVQSDATSCMGNLVMGVANYEIHNVAFLPKDRWMFETFSKLLGFVKSTIDTHKAILVQDRIKAIQRTGFLDL